MRAALLCSGQNSGNRFRCSLKGCVRGKEEDFPAELSSAEALRVEQFLPVAISCTLKMVVGEALALEGITWATHRSECQPSHPARLDPSSPSVY